MADVFLKSHSNSFGDGFDNGFARANAELEASLNLGVAKKLSGTAKVVLSTRCRLDIVGESAQNRTIVRHS